MKVIWSQTAIDTYLHIIDTIFEKWTLKEVLHFQKEVDKLLERLKMHNELCPLSKQLNYRKCVVSEQTSLIYSLTKKDIYLVTFIDNRSLHSF